MIEQQSAKEDFILFDVFIKSMFWKARLGIQFFFFLFCSVPFFYFLFSIFSFGSALTGVVPPLAFRGVWCRLPGGGRIKYQTIIFFSFRFPVTSNCPT